MIVSALFALMMPGLASAGSVLSEIDAANKAFAKAILAGDVDYLVNDYTDDGCIIAPKSPKACGKDAIREFWKAVVGSNPGNVEIITQSAEKESSVAYATGELLITDAKAVVHENRFILVFRNVDGSWKLHIDAWTPK